MPDTKKKKKSAPLAKGDSKLFPIVGVGASAGGLDAFKRLLKNIPEKSGMAFVLVQHLDPNHVSMLPEILQRVTKIPVHEITDDIKLVPDNIYIMPSSKILTTEEGVLCLKPRENFKTNLLINVFFESLAEVHEEHAYGVLLSGTGHDGTIGFKAIKDNGGVTIAQDLDTAAYPDMPKSAIDSGTVDLILSPEEIPDRLMKIFKNDPEVDKKEKTESVSEDDESVYKEILSILEERSGIDFTYYKQSTIRRRIARRMVLLKKGKLKDYLNFLESDKSEQETLFQDMLIPVTSFFRDPETFDFLVDTIFPLLLKERSADNPIRLWVVGCSTGEEAYTLAILLNEFFDKNSKKLNYCRLPVQIFASDISVIAIKKARKGIFSQASVKKLSDNLLKKYFHKRSNDTYVADRSIRDMCVFAPHNILKDPPFKRIDLISCRNVLIYFDNFLQKKAFTAFHYSLEENGFLLLGKSESANSATNLFKTQDKKHKVYSRKAVDSRFIHFGALGSQNTDTTKTKEITDTEKISTLPEKLQTDFKKSAEERLLKEYTPAAVIVNEQMDIVHIHGRITPFLEPSPGKPNFNLLKMAREGLGFELRNALQKARTTHQTIIKEGIPSNANGDHLRVTIEVVPLKKTVEPHYMVLFTSEPIEKNINSDEAGKALSPDIKAEQRANQLEKELDEAREDMRNISEEQEIVNEELQSANEELQSSNEEMQSLNEELETSKEELQSSLEELTTVNQELYDKQDQLNNALLFSRSIVSTLRHPFIVLDRSLRIKTANEPFYKKFKTDKEEIEGKLFFKIQNQQWDDGEIRTLLEKILPEKQTLTDFEATLDFDLLGERTILLNARQIINTPSDKKLILLVIEDVTEMRKSNYRLQASETKFKQLTQTMPHLIWTASPDGKLNFFNQFMLDYTGKTLKSLKGDGWQKIISPDDRERSLEKWKESTETGEEFSIENQLRDHDGNYLWHIGRAVTQLDNQGNILSWVGSYTNIHEQKIAEERKDEFIGIASHELKTPLTTAKGYIELLLLSLTEEDKQALLYGTKVYEAIDRLKNLITELLDVSKIKNGRLNYSFTTFDFNKLLSETIKDMNQMSNSHKIIITGKCNAEITGDKERLQQVIINLLTNAVKYSPKSKEVSVSIEEKNKTLQVSVRDTGIGISKKHLDKIFNRYYRVEEHSKEFQGMGIGLYISYEIIKRHDGKMWVESTPKRSTTFHFTLPI